MTDRELMQQALDALETALETMKEDWHAIDNEFGPSEGGLEAAIDGGLTGYEYFQETINAITALRERLAQPEQEMVPLKDYKDLSALCTRQGIRLMELEDAQQEQEPVFDCPRCGHCCPQRTWVGLTDEEIDKIYETKVWDARRSFARAIEAKLKEKNGL